MKSLAAVAALAFIMANSAEASKPFRENYCVGSSPNAVPTQLQLAAFDQAVRSTGMFYRVCDGCSDSNKIIVYRRLTGLPSTKSFGDLVFKTWSSEKNKLGTDFEMYGSFKDAFSQQNPWSFCNYDDEGVGFPRDCGATGPSAFQWNTLDASKRFATEAKNVQFCTL